jgi:hypothetical protein
LRYCFREEEQKQIGWSAKRELAKINYHIHTDAIKEHLVPKELTAKQASIIYADEADVLNMVLFGITAADWRKANPGLKGNVRDYASINEQFAFPTWKILTRRLSMRIGPQKERLLKLNAITIQQMRILQTVEGRKLLK